MKQVLTFIMLFCSTYLFSQSFSGEAKIWRGEEQHTVVYIAIEYNSLCISYANGTDYSFHGVWKQKTHDEYRLSISDDMYWAFNSKTKQLTLHDTEEETPAIYVMQ